MRLVVICGALALLLALVGCAETLPSTGAIGDVLQVGEIIVSATNVEQIPFETIFDRVPEDDRETFQTASQLKPEHRVFVVDVEYTNKGIQPIKIQQDQWRLVMTDSAFAAYKAEQERLAAEEAAAAAEAAEGEEGAEPEAKEEEDPEAEGEEGEEEEPAVEEEPVEITNTVAKAGGDFYVIQYYPEARVAPTVRVGANVTEKAKICMVTVPKDMSLSDMVLVFHNRLEDLEATFTLQ